MIEPRGVAGIYVRISMDREGAGLGVERQEADCRPVCHQRGYSDGQIRVYCDNDVSAYSGQRRPEYERLLQDVEAGVVGLVATWHTDRLYRRADELERLIPIIERAGIDVGTAKAGSLDLATPTGRMVARLLGATAAFESEHKAERLRAKHLQLAAQGKNAGGGRPYGFEPDRLTIRRSEAELIREAAGRILDDGESLGSVCRDWNARGVASARSGRWTARALRIILVSARISGRRERQIGKDGRRLGIGYITNPQAEWDGIISAEQSDRLRQRFANHERRGPRYTYLLTGGIARCGLCGAKLIARPWRDKRCLVCVKDPENSKAGCGRIRIAAEPLEDLVAAAVRRRVASGALLDALRETDDHGVHEELLQVEMDLAHLSREWGSGRLKLTEWQAAREPLLAREEGLRRRIELARRHRHLDGIPDPLDEAAWRSLPLVRQRAIVTALVDTLMVDPGKPGRFDPARFRLRWKT